MSARAEKFAAAPGVPDAGEEFVQVNGAAEDDDAAYPPTHDFDAEPVFTGTFAGTKSIPTKHGPRNKHVFKPADGYDNGAEVWGSTVIDQELAGLDEGQRIRIVFQGTRVAGNGNTFKAFDILVAKSSMKA